MAVSEKLLTLFCHVFSSRSVQYYGSLRSNHVSLNYQRYFIPYHAIRSYTCRTWRDNTFTHRQFFLRFLLRFSLRRSRGARKYAKPLLYSLISSAFLSLVFLQNDQKDDFRHRVLRAAERERKRIGIRGSARGARARNTERDARTASLGLTSLA